MNSASHHIGPDSAPDRYRLLNSIGRGGEAVLYRAEIELDGAPETVVVKVLDSKTTITIEQFQRLSAKWQEQAELLRFVNRPGVVGVREHFEGSPIHGRGDASTAPGRALVLVMNHVEGLDLRDWRAERTLSTPAERREALRALEQIADVLDWLHSGRATPSGRTVVHGDLSPGNVMVDEHGQATLVDFGLSKLTADHQTAEVWFTPGYAAPEVFEGKRTPNTDRYAFGAIAYFLLSGQSPPATPEQLRAALLALPQVTAATPDRIERILRVCAAEPDRRPESLSAWVKDIRSAVVSTTVSGPSARDAAPGAPVRDAVPGAVPMAAPPPPLLPPGTPPGGSPAAADAGAQPGFPPPITASGDPGVPLPTTVNPGPVTASYTASGHAPEQSVAGHAYAAQPPLTPQGPSQPPAPQKKKRKTLRVVLPVVAVLLAAALGALGAQAMLNNDDTNTDGAHGTGSSAASTPSDTDAGASSEEPGDGSGASSPSGDQTTPGTVEEASEVSLTTMTPVAEPDAFEVGSTTLNTQVHNDAFVASPSCNTEPYMEFNLNRAWTDFDLTAGIDDNSNYESGRLTIKVDDKTAWTGELTLGKPQKLTLPVQGGLRLRIHVDSNCDGAVLTLGTPLLKR
ncbi:protein kinase [Streptomyces sp. NPDC052052]|uniref:protein kinase domain-containing protein n=1 Tax=Streptomyces sp. NPDC052052 TaxID=3154756 RepID=UPI00343AABFA